MAYGVSGISLILLGCFMIARNRRVAVWFMEQVEKVREYTNTTSSYDGCFVTMIRSWTILCGVALIIMGINFCCLAIGGGG